MSAMWGASPAAAARTGRTGRSDKFASVAATVRARETIVASLPSASRAMAQFYATGRVTKHQGVRRARSAATPHVEFLSAHLPTLKKKKNKIKKNNF